MPGRNLWLPLLILAAGYTVASYGYVLARGWNITFRQWVDPLTPWQWPAQGGELLCVPPGHVFPVRGQGVQCGKSAGSKVRYGKPGTAEANVPVSIVGNIRGGFHGA